MSITFMRVMHHYKDDKEDYHFGYEADCAKFDAVALKILAKNLVVHFQNLVKNIYITRKRGDEYSKKIFFFKNLQYNIIYYSIKAEDEPLLTYPQP